MIKLEPLHLESHNDWRLIPMVMTNPKIPMEIQIELNKTEKLIVNYYKKMMETYHAYTKDYTN